MKFSCLGKCGNLLDQQGICDECEQKLEDHRQALILEEENKKKILGEERKKVLADCEKTRLGKKTKYRYLLNWWRAKDIQEVVENNDKLDIDQLVFKYIPYPVPNQLLDTLKKEGLFDDYDYIILTSPDLVVKEENLEQLIHDVETTDSAVMTGVCNVDLDMNKNNYASCIKKVNGRRYVWVGMDDNISGIHEVKFNGMVLMAIRIDLFNTYKFYTGLNDDPTDLKFCRWCITKGIPIMCNFDNYMKHLRYVGKLQVGKKTPEVWFRGKQIFTQELPAKPFLPTPITFI